MRVIFCSSPLNGREVDSDYEKEYFAVKKYGVVVNLIDLEELIQGNLRKAFLNVTIANKMELGIYRGWMMSPSNYEILYFELLKRGIRLINTPENYKYCHYLPEAYDVIKEHTPKTVWVQKEESGIPFKKLHNQIKEFGTLPVIVKDYVKSCKHQWNDACYVHDAADLSNFDRVVRNLIHIRGEDFEGGIIVREFVELEFLSRHPKSKMPLSKEFRLFFLRHNLLKVFNYWEEADYHDEMPPEEQISKFVEVAKKIESEFFTMDIAKTAEGEWVIIELGDGQVSGLPYNSDLNSFYSELQSQCNKLEWVIDRDLKPQLVEKNASFREEKLSEEELRILREYEGI